MDLVNKEFNAFEVSHRKPRMPFVPCSRPRWLHVPDAWSKLFQYAFQDLYGAPNGRVVSIPHTVLVINDWIFGACLPADKKPLLMIRDRLKAAKLAPGPPEGLRQVISEYGIYVRYYVSAQPRIHDIPWKDEVTVWREFFAQSNSPISAAVSKRPPQRTVKQISKASQKGSQEGKLPLRPSPSQGLVVDNNCKELQGILHYSVRKEAEPQPLQRRGSSLTIPTRRGSVRFTLGRKEQQKLSDGASSNNGGI